MNKKNGSELGKKFPCPVCGGEDVTLKDYILSELEWKKVLSCHNPDCMAIYTEMDSDNAREKNEEFVGWVFSR